MQNRYVGDIGDFGKLGLLRVLQDRNLTIGVNWYLTPDEKHNNDGMHIEYLDNEECRQCDNVLWDELKRIIDTKRREVYALQNESILKAKFFDKVLDFKGKTKVERISIRKNWHGDALECLRGVDVVFIDPDNGLVVPSAKGKTKENKYVIPDELADYYNQGSSVIYYQHKARRTDSFYSRQFELLLKSLQIENAAGYVLKFIKTSQRYYFLILQPQHREIVEKAVAEMISSSWGDYFCLL